MSQSVFSKHTRIKVHKTPILEELISYSRNSSKPNQVHLDKILTVWRDLPSSEQIMYQHLPDMSFNLPKYLTKSQINGFSKSPKVRRLKKILPGRSFSLEKLAKPTPIMSSPYVNSNLKAKVSPRTKNIALSLNKHKLNPILERYQFLQEMEHSDNSIHKLKCNCKISEIVLDLCITDETIGNKLFIGCKYAASDFTTLISKQIFAILSIGSEPTHFSSIRGGYCKVVYDGFSLLKPLQIFTRFLNDKFKKGNILINCESGNKFSGMLLIAYFLREFHLSFQCAFNLIKKSRPNFSLSADEEILLSYYDNTKPTDGVF